MKWSRKLGREVPITTKRGRGGKVIPFPKRGRTMPSDTPYGRMVRGIMEEVGAIPPRRRALAAVANPVRSVADPTAARELALYAENDAGLYRQHRRLIEKNLVKRLEKGTYNHAMALKAWEHFARFAAEKYAREFGGTFSAATRRLAAEHFRKVFEDEARATGVWR